MTRWLIGVCLLAGCTAHKPCPGDCNGDGTVSQEEIRTVAAIALGRGDMSYCPKAKWINPGRVSPDDLAAAIDAQRDGCP